jgi:pilus assembly protein Flp/PilA
MAMNPRSNLQATLTRMRERIIRDEQGGTAVEYALIASGIGAAIAATVWSFGTSLTGVYDSVAALF